MDINHGTNKETLLLSAEDKHIFISTLLGGDFYDILCLHVLPGVLSGYSSFLQHSKKRIRLMGHSGRPSGVSVWVNGV